MSSKSFNTVMIALLGLASGWLIAQPTAPASAVATAQDAGKPPLDLQSLQADIERLKKVVPDQAHAMQDVDYHFANLWFAAQHSNWPLAQFYFNETRSHLRWAVRIIPVRKDNAGKEIKLEEILQAVENSPLMQLEEALKAKDREKFVTAYEFTLTSCYSCHKAADKPYLRPRIPEHPASAVMNMDPNATWPK
jgi:hypothetical protein